MRTIVLAVVFLGAALRTEPGFFLDQEKTPHESTPKTLSAELPGAALKWIHIAETEFERQKLDVGKYTISVTEEHDSVFVSLMNAGRHDGVRGNPGSLPEIVVEIRKSDAKIVHSSYVR